MTDDERQALIDDAVRKEMQEQIDRDMLAMMGGASGRDIYTTAAEQDLPTLTIDTLRDLCGEWEKQAREMRRHDDATIVVDRAHEGEPLTYRHSVDGHFYEMTWRQAQILHERVPLVLIKVRSEDAAEFQPAGPFDRFIPKYLPMPPYELPPDDTGSPRTQGGETP